MALSGGASNLLANIEFPNEHTAADKGAGERWYVAHTLPREEAVAVFHLERQHYAVFCPLLSKPIHHARKIRVASVPLFPRYLFVRFNVSCNPWRSINGTRGVTRLIMSNEMPLAVPEGVVERLQLSSCQSVRTKEAREFKVGQTVCISEGPFENLLGTLERLDSDGRVQVLLDLLGRSVSVTLPSEKLRHRC